MAGALDPLPKLKEAREYAQNTKGADFLVVRKQGQSPSVGELDVGLHAEDKLTQLVYDEISDHISRLQNGIAQARELDVVNTLTKERVIQYCTPSDLPDTELLNLLTTRQDYKETRFTEEPTPNFQLIRIQEPKGPVLIGVQNFQNTELINTKKGLTMWFEGDKYELFQGEMLVVRDNLNALYFDGHLFIMTPKSFESMFNLRDEYEREAKVTLSNYAEQGIKFANDEIEDWLLSHINMLRELYEISESGLPDRTDPETVAQVVENYNLDIKYEKHDGEIELDIDTYPECWQLLRVLGAKYAESREMATRWEIDEGNRIS